MSAARSIQILLLLLSSSAFAGSASAAEQSAVSAPPATVTENTPQAQEERAAAPEQAKPAKPAAQGQPGATPTAKRAPVRRRSVQQAIGSVVQPSATQTYGPVLTPPAYTYPAQSNPALPPVAGVHAITPPPPSQLNSCAGSFCTDAAGATYNGGVGSAAVNSQGRLCNKVGNTMQCF